MGIVGLQKGWKKQACGGKLEYKRHGSGSPRPVVYTWGTGGDMGEAGLWGQLVYRRAHGV